MRAEEYIDSFETEERLIALVRRLESRLDDDSAATIQFEDIAFQLADLRERIEDLHSKRSRADNIYFWMVLVISFMTLLAVVYIATELMVGSTVL